MLLLACIEAESSLVPYAERWGDRTRDARFALHDPVKLGQIIADLEARGLGADLSFGYGQMTVQTAAGYQLGDGSNRVENVLHVRQALFNRELSVNVTAAHLHLCQRSVEQKPDHPVVRADKALASLVRYNAGWLPPPDSDWWRVWSQNVARFKKALRWARGLVG